MVLSIVCCATIIFKSSSKVPVQGNSLQLSCLVDTTSQDVNYDTTWYSPQTSGEFGKCYRQVMKCSGGTMTHQLTADVNGSYLNIQVLNRSLDEGCWRCIYSGQGQVVQADLNLTVYTIPQALVFKLVPTMDVDLSVTSARLNCATSGCTYPPPSIQWLTKDQTSSSPYEVYKTVNPTGTGGSCVPPEQLYTSTLDLQQITTWSDNSDKVLIFSCRIEYPDSTMNLITSGSYTIKFAVRVTEAFLQLNNQNITSTLTVNSGQPVTLTCITGTSRPDPIIDWYIGSRSVGSGTSLTFTPSNTDHNGTIYCQAYNIDPNLKVDSSKPSLFVRAAPKILDVSQSYKGYVGQYTMIQFNFNSITKENLTITARHSYSSGLIHQGIIRPNLLDIIPINSSQIPMPDFRATVAISIMSENDFGHYVIETKNIVGSDSKNIQILQQITPEKPFSFHSTNVQEKQLSLRWQAGYNGGYTQTFIVEISLDNITWNNASQVSAGNRDGWFTTVIEDLIPGSEYYFRLYAYNINGRGDFADVQLAIRTFKGQVNITSDQMGISSIHLLYFSKRRTDNELHSYSNTEMNPQTVKPIYEELNKGNTEPSVYDTISPL
ncbi:hypothetical protein ACJMK2_027413 [Sinanodonta woodiana]|uniref:Uncharacterized protein n=1 Tax=Sinanodonta woodiana TaxID=1069815 RepID=A0ABD3XN07_SINWO